MKIIQKILKKISYYQSAKKINKKEYIEKECGVIEQKNKWKTRGIK